MDDIEAIKQVKGRLSRANDTQDWVATRACLADDYTVTTPDGRVVAGADAFVETLSRSLAGLFTMHASHAPEIELTSPTTARGTWLIEDLVRFPDGRELHAYGINHDTYVKVGDRWLVAGATMEPLGRGGGGPDPMRRTLAPATLADREAIMERLHQYCRAMDAIDYELGYGVWHPDGTAEYDDRFRGTGREFVDWVQPQHEKMRGRSHQVASTSIQVDGVHATSEAYVTACLRFGTKDTVVRGRYLDTWSLRDGEWRIDARRYETDLVQIIPIDASLLPST